MDTLQQWLNQWMIDAYEGRIPDVYNKWCNTWNAEEKRFEGDEQDATFENFCRRVDWAEAMRRKYGTPKG